MRMWGYKRVWVILGVLVLLVAWIAIGSLYREDEEEPVEEVADDRRTAVAVRESDAQPIERVLVLHGDLRPEQVVLVRAETGGVIEEWYVPRGAAVEQGEPLVQIELGERRSELNQARAQVNVAEQQLSATRELVAEGYEPEIQLETAEAEYEAAQAQLSAIEEDIDRTRIRAPIPGRVDQRIAERGDFVAAGGEVVQIVNNDPLRANVAVPQHRIGRIEVGQTARVHVLEHGVAEGEVTFVSTLADPATRTFLVEVEIPNPDRTLPAGTSAEVEIPTELVAAHLVSPAIVSLDDEGRVGVKTVDENDRVAFHTIEVVRGERHGLWVSGLPDQARIITVGQGFVRPGEDVAPHPEEMVAADESPVPDEVGAAQ